MALAISGSRLASVSVKNPLLTVSWAASGIGDSLVAAVRMTLKYALAKRFTTTHHRTRQKAASRKRRAGTGA
ncbi:hypothetical protein GCM10007417_15550 [Glycocaulis alkaliphilus]|nr:hypothetical protein GCM10007417_15550 [Glycocaulis alkaliphilus]